MDQRPEGREGAISALNEAVEDLNPAKTSNIPPAKAVFGSVAILLTTVRVCFLLFRSDLLQVHTQPGLNDQRTGLRRARAILRQCLSNA